MKVKISLFIYFTSYNLIYIKEENVNIPNQWVNQPYASKNISLSQLDVY